MTSLEERQVRSDADGSEPSWPDKAIRGSRRTVLNRGGRGAGAGLQTLRTELRMRTAKSWLPIALLPDKDAVNDHSERRRP